jgi:hypothetical protein
MTKNDLSNIVIHLEDDVTIEIDNDGDFCINEANWYLSPETLELALAIANAVKEFNS